MARDRASRPEAKPLRLFVAVSIPEEAKAAIATALAPWRREFPRARWAPPENWHVTLRFLGSTWPRLVEWVQEQVADVAAKAGPFQTRVESLGAFPSAEHARVLWAGLEDPDERTGGIVWDLNAALAGEFPAETRAFRPHLTVARSDPPLHLPATFSQTALQTEEFLIDRLVLFRSHLRRPAPFYEQLGSYRLGGG
jgi:2'-5' RNA ligase